VPNRTELPGVEIIAQSAALAPGVNPFGAVSSNGLRLKMDVNCDAGQAGPERQLGGTSHFARSLSVVAGSTGHCSRRPLHSIHCVPNFCGSPRSMRSRS